MSEFWSWLHGLPKLGGWLPKMRQRWSLVCMEIRQGATLLGHSIYVERAEWEWDAEAEELIRPAPGAIMRMSVEMLEAANPDLIRCAGCIIHWGSYRLRVLGYHIPSYSVVAVATPFAWFVVTFWHIVRVSRDVAKSTQMRWWRFWRRYAHWLTGYQERER